MELRDLLANVSQGTQIRISQGDQQPDAALADDLADHLGEVGVVARRHGDDLVAVVRSRRAGRLAVQAEDRAGDPGIQARPPEMPDQLHATTNARKSDRQVRSHELRSC